MMQHMLLFDRLRVYPSCFSSDLHQRTRARREPFVDQMKRFVLQRQQIGREHVLMDRTAHAFVIVRVLVEHAFNALLVHALEPTGCRRGRAGRRRAHQPGRRLHRRGRRAGRGRHLRD